MASKKKLIVWGILIFGLLVISFIMVKAWFNVGTKSMVRYIMDAGQLPALPVSAQILSVHQSSGWVKSRSLRFGAPAAEIQSWVEVCKRHVTGLDEDEIQKVKGIQCFHFPLKNPRPGHWGKFEVESSGVVVRVEIGMPEGSP